MYINVNVNGASNIKVAAVSVAELRVIEKNIIAKSRDADETLEEIIIEGDTQVARVIAEGDTQVGLVTAEGDTQVGLVTAEGDTQVGLVTAEGIEQVDLVTTEGIEQVARVIAEGDTQDARVTAQGDIQDTRVVTEGNTQVARVSAEGDAQFARSGAEADRAEQEADRAEQEAARATEQADSIKAVTVASPVIAVPLLPNNVPGVPTVTYDPVTGEFTYGIPTGKTGEPAQVVTPMGGITVAEVNAFTVDPILGAGYWMEDAGTITYGIDDVVVAIDEIIVWTGESSFFNMGLLESGSRWDLVTDVTVEGFAPALGDDLARNGTAYTKAELDAIVAGYLALTGGTMTGKLTMKNDILASTISCEAGAANENSYFEVNNNLGERVGYVGNIEGTMSLVADTIGSDGNVYIANPTAKTQTQGSLPNSLTRKDYVDTKLPLAGGTMTGDMLLSNDIRLMGIEVGGLTKTIAYISGDDTIRFGTDDGKIQYMLGDISYLDSIPKVDASLAQGTSDTELTRKDYVDTKLSKTDGGVINGNLDIVKTSPTLWFRDTVFDGNVFHMQQQNTGTFRLALFDSVNTFISNVMTVSPTDGKVSFSFCPNAYGGQSSDINSLTRKEYVDGLETAQNTRITAIEARDTSQDLRLDDLDDAVALNTAKVGLTQEQSDALDVSVALENRVWVDETLNRVVADEYTNDSGYSIIVSLIAILTADVDNGISLLVDGVTLQSIRQYAGSTTQITNMQVVVPNGSTYQVVRIIGSTTVSTWSELK